MEKEISTIQLVAVLSTTVLPLDGVYSVETVDVNNINIEGVPHYIGHPSTKELVEKLGAVQAESKLFKGLEPGETAVCFSIKQGRSTRAKDGFTSPHQDTTPSDIECRIIHRLCRDFQYEVDKVYEENVVPSICESGLHFCK